MSNKCKEIRILTEILKVKNLTSTQKILLSQIEVLDKEEGCFATNSYFAELFSLSKTQVSNIISDLKRKGWITVEMVYKNNSKEIEKRIIRVNHPPYPNVVKESIKVDKDTSIKAECKDKYKSNKYKYNNRANFEQRNYSDFDWDSLYCNFEEEKDGEQK